MWPLYYNCIETSDICNFARYCYNNYHNFHILGIQPVYGYMENKVNEWMNEPGGLLLCSQKSTTSFYPEPINPVQIPPFCFSIVGISIILSPMPGSSKWTLSFRFPFQNPSCIPYKHHMPQPTHSSRFNYRNNVWRHLLTHTHTHTHTNTHKHKHTHTPTHTHKSHHTT